MEQNEGSELVCLLLDLSEFHTAIFKVNTFEKIIEKVILFSLKVMASKKVLSLTTTPPHFLSAELQQEGLVPIPLSLLE